LTKYFKKQQNIEIRVLCKQIIKSENKTKFENSFASTTLVLLKSISKPLTRSHKKNNNLIM